MESNNGNQYAQYMLGKLYLRGEHVSGDKKMAEKYFTLSAEQDNKYAKYFLNNLDRVHRPSILLSTSKLFNHMGKIFEDIIPLKSPIVGSKIDSKLLRKLREKKVAQGHKSDNNEQRTSL